jgi:hypothetical protein
MKKQEKLQLLRNFKEIPLIENVIRPLLEKIGRQEDRKIGRWENSWLVGKGSEGRSLGVRVVLEDSGSVNQ